VEVLIARVRRDYRGLAEPLDFGCPRLEVRTDDGYDPALAEVMIAIEAEYRVAEVGHQF
jgi:hypothetical protein